MSPQPSTLARFNFAPFDEDGLPPGLIEAVRYARERATLLLAPLAAKRSSILNNSHLSDQGRASDLKELQRTVGIDLDNTYAHAHDRAQAVVDDCNRKLSGRLFHEVDGIEANKRDAIAAVRLELLELARDGRREATGAAVPYDSASGAALLAGGNSAHKLIHEVLTKGTLADAKLLALAVSRSGPIARHLLGGQAVEQAVLGSLTARVVLEDPVAAEIVATRSQGERVVAVIKGHKSTATAALARAARLDGSAAPATPSHEDTDE